MSTASLGASPSDPYASADAPYSVETPPHWAVIDVPGCRGTAPADIAAQLLDLDGLTAQDREKCLALVSELLDQSAASGTDIVALSCFPKPDGTIFYGSLTLSWLLDTSGNLPAALDDMLRMPDSSPLDVDAGRGVLVGGRSSAPSSWAAAFPEKDVPSAHVLVLTEGNELGALITGTAGSDDDASLLLSLVRRMAETLRLAPGNAEFDSLKSGGPRPSIAMVRSRSDDVTATEADPNATPNVTERSSREDDR